MKMNANLQYWPKVGETVSYSAKPVDENSKITGIKEELPYAILFSVAIAQCRSGSV